MEKKEYKHQYRNIVNRALATAFELWMKGVPIEMGPFLFKTAMKQQIVIRKTKKRKKKPYYDIIFDVKMITLSKTKIKGTKIKTFRLTRNQIRSLMPEIIK